jgi:hypothetical protein
MPAYPKRLEILAEAIARYSGYSEPDSELYQARNPGALKATSMRHVANEHGHRVFNSFIDGMQALLFDLNTKLSGNSWTGINQESTLEDLALSYSQPFTLADAWSKHLRKAMQEHIDRHNHRIECGECSRDEVLQG